MDTFFHYLKKALVGCIALIFAFIVIYTPQDYTKIAKAGGPATGGSSEVTQVLNLGQLVKTGGSAIKSAISDGKLAVKEFTLDQIAWAAFKGALVFMAEQMVTWINGGFRSGPAFVQDLEEFLRREADAVIGNYIESLEIGEFLCEPFRVDIADTLVNINFVNRNTPSNCSLSDIIDNVEDFVSGTQGSFSRGGGWDTWIRTTSNPTNATALGQLFAEQTDITEQRLEKKSEERSKLGWGNGFLSITTCNDSTDSTPLREQIENSGGNCRVQTPGQLINESINNHLDSNRESLLAADEFTEAVGSFISMVAGGTFASFSQNGFADRTDGGATAESVVRTDEIELEMEELIQEAEEAEAAATEASAEREAEERENVQNLVDGAVDGIVGGVSGAINGAGSGDGPSASSSVPVIDTSIEDAIRDFFQGPQP